MRRFVGLGTAIFLLGAAAPATAATITVTVTFDDQFAGDGQCSLRKAINDVNSPGSSQTDCAPAAFGANTIVLDAQRYLLGGSFPPGAGQLTIAPTVKNLSITGAGVNATTIDAASLNNRVFQISGGATVTIAGLKIINGAAPAGATGSAGAAGATGSNGGAIFNQGGLTLNDAAVTNSHAGNGGGGGAGSGASGGDGGAGGSGGAIYNAASGNLTLNGVTIGNDFAGSGGNGGAGANSGAAGTTGGNGGPAGTGGGIENAGGSLTVVDSTVRGDLAGNGGSGGGGGSGTATGGNGGAGGAGANGGGISNDSGSLSVSNGTFASNFAGGGGTGGNGGPGGSAAGGDGGSGGAGGSGGGIAAATPANASLLQATVAGNNAGSGGAGGGGGTGSPNGAGGSAGGAGSTGGVFDQGSAITLRNSLLSINGGGNCAGAVLDGGFNLSSGDSSCPATFASGDPNLGPLQDNGGPAPTIALQPGSAAINQIPASGANCPPSDERGAPRPAGSGGAKCDIGAYEVVPPVAITGAATNVSLTGATLVGSVTPYAGSAGVVFQYGTTTKYGQTTPLQHIGGVVATPVTAKLTRLTPNTTYHFRVVIVAMDGTAIGADGTFTTSLVPSITRLSVTPKSFKPSRGATISYRDSVSARTTLTALRCVKSKKRKCTRYKKLAAFSRKDAAGLNKVKIKRRFGRRLLLPGSYRLQLTPRANGRTGKTVTTTFKVV